MKQWSRQFVTVAGNSFTVLMGDPLTFIIHIFIICVTLLIACLPGFTLGGQLKLVRDQAVALTFIAGSLLAAVGAARIICDDLRKGMLPTIMSRPVSFSALITGKWAGVVLTLAVILTTSTTAYLWSSRIIAREHFIEPLGLMVFMGAVGITLLAVAVRHYRKGGNYMWQANLLLLPVLTVSFIVLNLWGYNGAEQSYGILVDWRGALVYVYLFMAFSVFTAVVTLLAVLMDVSMLLAFSAVLFFIGLFSGYIIDQAAPGHFLNAVCNVILPNWQQYWVTEIISSPKVLEIPFILSRCLGAFLQSVLFLIAATVFFERKEIAGSI